MHKLKQLCRIDSFKLYN